MWLEPRDSLLSCHTPRIADAGIALSALVRSLDDFCRQTGPQGCWTERTAQSYTRIAIARSSQDTACPAPIYERHAFRIPVPNMYALEHLALCPSMAAVYAPGTQFPVPLCPPCMLSACGTIMVQTLFACSRIAPGSVFANPRTNRKTALGCRQLASTRLWTQVKRAAERERQDVVCVCRQAQRLNGMAAGSAPRAVRSRNRRLRQGGQYPANRSPDHRISLADVQASGHT